MAAELDLELGTMPSTYSSILDLVGASFVAAELDLGTYSSLDNIVGTSFSRTYLVNLESSLLPYSSRLFVGMVIFNYASRTVMLYQYRRQTTFYMNEQE
jgi:hypothetical protein